MSKLISILFFLGCCSGAHACGWYRVDCWVEQGIQVVRDPVLEAERVTQAALINSANVTANEATWLAQQAGPAYRAASAAVVNESKVVINVIRNELDKVWGEFLLAISKSEIDRATPYANRLRSAVVAAPAVSQALNRVVRAILSGNVTDATLSDFRMLGTIIAGSPTASSRQGFIRVASRDEMLFGPYCSWGIRVPVSVQVADGVGGQGVFEQTLWMSRDFRNIKLETSAGGGIAAGEGSSLDVSVQAVFSPECVGEMHDAGWVGIEGIVGRFSAKVSWEGLKVGIRGAGHAIPFIALGIAPIELGEFKGGTITGGYAGFHDILMGSEKSALNPVPIAGLSPLFLGWSADRHDTRTQVGADFPDGRYGGISQIGYILSDPRTFFSVYGIPPRPVKPLCIQWSSGRRDSRTIAGEVGASDCYREPGYLPDTSQKSVVPGNQNNTVIGWVLSENDQTLSSRTLCSGYSGERSDSITQVGCDLPDGGYGDNRWLQGYILPPTFVPGVSPVRATGQVCSGLDGTYELRDNKFGVAMVAGDVANNHIYHQARQGRANGLWRLSPDEDCTFILRDVKHGLALVGGDVPDGNVYHQQPGFRLVARWRIFRAPTENQYILRNARHNLSPVPGQVPDGNIYYHEYAGVNWIFID